MEYDELNLPPPFFFFLFFLKNERNNPYIRLTTENFH